MDPSDPYKLRGRSSIRERFAERLSKFQNRARREAPGVAKRAAKRAGVGLAHVGKEFASNAALNINTGKQQQHWDDLTDAIMGGGSGGAHAQDVNDAILGRSSGLPRRRSRGQSHSTHIHTGGGSRHRRGRRSQEGALLDLMEGK